MPADALLTLAPRRVLDHHLLTSDAVVAQETTTLFVDLAGFTAMTERMTSMGSRGVERLSDVLRGFFGEVTDTVTGAGGDLLAFGGDAITAVFDGPPGPALTAAGGAAAEIGSLAGRFTTTPSADSSIRLRTRIGIARGLVATTVARAARRSIPVHVGNGLDLAVAAQAAADADQLVIDPTARASSGGTDDPAVVSPGIGSAAADLGSELARLAPAPVVDRMITGREQLRSHRRICVAFVRFPGVRSDGLRGFVPTVGSLLDRVDAWEGEVVQVAGGDKGVVAMVVFGAPLAHGDDPLRAIEAMLRLREEDPSAAIGVATGPVYAALLGSRRRLLPTHVGLAVTTAARMMERARPGQLLVEGETWSEVSGHIAGVGPTRTVTLRGHRRPVEVRVVRGWRSSRHTRTAPTYPPLVGRLDEVRALDRFLDGIGEGRGGHLEMVGVPGIGKTRLVQEALDRARTRSIAVASVDTHAYPRGRARDLWRDLLGAVVGVSRHAGAEQWRAALTGLLPQASGHVEVLDRLLGVGLAGEVERSRAEEERLGRELAQGLLADLLAAASRTRPLLAAVENVDRLHADEAQVVAALPALLEGSRAGILTTRQLGQEETRPPAGVPGGPLRLSELTPDDAALLAADAWREAGGGRPPPWLERAVRRAAGGHPLYVRVAAAALHDSWAPGEPPPSPRTGTAHPSLRAVLTERIDRMEDPDRELVAVLAVAGGPCPAEVVAELADGIADVAQAQRIAQQLADRRLVQIDTRATGQHVRLSYEVLRQAVYESMSHAERDRLHRRFVECLDRRRADPVEVAHHVAALGDPELVRRWFPQAAAAARLEWSLEDAVRFLEQVLPLMTGRERKQVEVELLEILLVSGRANELLDRASALGVPPPGSVSTPREAWGSDRVLTARRSQAIAAAAHACGRYDESEAAARQVMGLCDGADDLLYHRAAELLVLVQCERGDTRAAVAAGEDLVARALRQDRPPAVATARAALGAALLMSGRPADAAEHYEAALAGARAVGDAVLQVHVLSDLAGCAFESGQHGRCLALLGEAREIADRIGYRRHLAFSLGNEAQLRAALGDPYATACAAVSVRRSLEMGDPAAAADAVHTWLTASAELTADVGCWRRLATIDQRLDRAAAAAGDSADLALAAARAGCREEALGAASSADEAARAADLPHVRRRAALARALAELEPASPRSRDGFVACLDRLAAEDDVDPVETAVLALERWRVTPTDAHHAAAVTTAAAAFEHEPSLPVRAWFAELGVPLPDPPDPLPAPAGIAAPLTTHDQLAQALSRLEAMAATVRHRG